MIIDHDHGIVMLDGTRLSAKIWRPDDSHTHPVPAILEYLPYRKTDWTAQRDDTMHPWFADQGYACLRVDRRGCGDSEGLFDDEYSEQEITDGIEVIRWIADQPWCTGNVGMQGISWGGFNSVQIAACAPKALKAVITIGTTVDRFHDDIHYKGGIQLSENIGWAATATSWCSMPPDPLLVGEKWRTMWLSRLDSFPFLAERWTRQSDRTAYWRHGSICENFGAIKTPVLVMGGLHDGYRNAMAAMVENLSGPVQGIVGPWSHKYPHISTIEPSIDYLNTALRWWDRWLKSIPNGAELDPKMRVYVMDSIAPDDCLTERPGKWIAERTWPSDESSLTRLSLSASGLGSGGPLSATIEPNLKCGESAGEFFPGGLGSAELPGDQRIDDERSCKFDSAPLETDQIVLGAPILKLSVSSRSPRAQIVARLCDVDPDGQSTLITMGLLNLRHRNGFEETEELVPGEIYEVAFMLDQAAYSVPSGHKLRLALSSSYWPYCWPEGKTEELLVSKGELGLPMRNSVGIKPCIFAPPLETKERAITVLRPATSEKSWHARDDGDRILKITADHGRKLDEETGLIMDTQLSEEWRINSSCSASAEARIEWKRSLARDKWEVSTHLVCVMKGTQTHFEIEQEMTAWEGDIQVFQNHKTARIPR